MRQAQIMVPRILQIGFGIPSEVWIKFSELMANIVVANHHRRAKIRQSPAHAKHFADPHFGVPPAKQ